MDLQKVCYITSEEPYLVKERIQAIKSECIDKYGEINVKEIGVEELSAELETVPFFAEKKLIFLNVEDNEGTTQLLKETPDTCCVVITDKLDKRKALYKFIKKAGEVIELAPYSESQMAKWIQSKAASMGATITEDVAHHLIEICGLSDMYLLHNEIIKLVSMEEPITCTLVDQVVTKTTEYTSFILTDMISQKEKKKAYEIIRVLAEQNEYLPVVVSLINRNFAILRMLKTLSDAEIKGAGIHPYTIKLLKPHARKFTLEELDFLLNCCQEIDFDMKNGMNHRIALEKIIGVIK